jgi:hypothetical protein
MDFRNDDILPQHYTASEPNNIPLVCSFIAVKTSNLASFNLVFKIQKNNMLLYIILKVVFLGSETSCHSLR